MWIWGLRDRLDAILCEVTVTRHLVLNLLNKENRIMATQQEIMDEIAAQSTVEDGILVLVQRLVSENDPTARQAILDGLLKNKDKLNAVVLAGTPQAPTP